MDAPAMTARVQHIWDGAQPAYAALVDDRVQDAKDLVMHLYDAAIHSTLGPCVQAPALEAFLAAVKAHLTASGAPDGGPVTFLDLAGGTGHPSLAIAEALPSARITLTDLSPNMVDFAAKRVAARGLGNRIATQQADAQSLTALKDDSFDVVTCMYGLFMMPDHGAALREGLRVLRPGGLLAFCVWGPDDKCQLPQLFRKAVEQLPFEAPPPQARRDRMADIEWTKGEVKTAGFEHVEAKVYEHVQACKADALEAMVCHMVLKSPLDQAAADGKAPAPDAGPKAFMAALEALGCLPKHGIVTLHNEGILYTTVKPQ